MSTEKFVAIKVKCPKCKKSLMDPYHPFHTKPSIALDIELEGIKGKQRLCSYYGCYDQEITIEVPDQTVLKYSCPSCKEELTSNSFCEECNAAMVPLTMEKGGRIYICSRRGCKGHYLHFDNVSDGLRKLYNEFGYF